MTYLNTPQLNQLLQGVNPKRVHNLRGMSHMEAYDIRAHLNRVFGFARWSADVISMELLYERHHPNKNGNDAVSVGYRAGLTLTVHSPDGDRLASYTEYAAGSASSFPVAKQADAHDMAIKGLAVDTVIPTPSGWTTMGDIRVGDLVFDMDGSPVRVGSKSEVKNLPCFRVRFGDGQEIICDNEHVWWAKVAQEKLKPKAIADLYEAKAAGKPVAIPVSGPISLPDADLPIDPYLLGYWLGDGDRSSGRITVGGQDLDETIAHLRSAGAEIGSIRKDKREGGAYCIRIGPSRAGSRDGLTASLRRSGILGRKAIPAAYMRASVQQRLAILQGLMDSDGTADGRRCVFTGADEALAMQVAELVRSLGDRASFCSGEKSGFGKSVTAHAVWWTPTLMPFRLSRKAGRVRLRMRSGAHRVVSIEKVDAVPTQCISVDSPTRSYLAGESMVPTHNTAESQALKRAAINLGDQFGLSLYNNGSPRPIVLDTLVIEREEKPVDEGAPEVVPGADAMPDVPAEEWQPSRDWVAEMREAVAAGADRDKKNEIYAGAVAEGAPSPYLDEVRRAGRG